MHIFASWPYLGVGSANFRKRAQRAPICRNTLTVQTCGPQALVKSPQSERSQAEGLFKSPAAYGSDFMLPHTRKGDRSYEIFRDLSTHIFASWPYLGVGSANFRKRAKRAPMP